MAVIDIHAHYLPVELGERFTKLSGRGYNLRHRPDMSGYLADMDEAGVDQQVLGLGAIQPYWADASASAEGARFANEMYASIARRNRRFSAIASVPLPHTGKAIEEVEYALGELGLLGVGIGCSAGGHPLDAAMFDDFWGALDEHEALVYLHPGVANDLAIGVGEYPLLLGPVFGSPAETAVAALRLALKGIPSRFPRIRFVFGAMGGALLLNYEKLTHSLRFAADHGEPFDPPAIEAALKSFWYDTSSLDELQALAAEKTVGLGRLVFGSDAPFGKAVKAREALERWTGPEQAQDILERTENLLS